MSRDNFSPKTKENLAKRVQYLCSFEECSVVTVGPSESGRRVAMVGVAAHITAAAPGGPRYDARLTKQQREAESNGIWLCQVHGKHVDDDEHRFSVELLRRAKAEAEARALRRIAHAASLSCKPLVMLRHDTLKSSIDPPNREDLPGLLQGREVQRVGADYVEYLEHRGTSRAALDAVARSMVTSSGAMRSCLADPRTDVLYFGFPHVPFGVLAGRIAGSHRHVRLVEHDRHTGRFRWGPGGELKLAPPAIRDRSKGSVARLFVSISAHVDEKICEKVVSARRSRIDVHVGLRKPFRGAIATEAQARHLVENIACEVDTAIGGVGGLDAVHVFAAVPVSVAFLLGQWVFAGTALPPAIVHSLVAAPKPAYRWGLNLFDAMAGRGVITVHGA